MEQRRGPVSRHPFVAVLTVLAIATAFAVPAVINALPAAADPCAPIVNPVVCENTLPGTNPNVWKITGAGDPTIQGYATDVSVQRGTTVSFKINTPATAYHLDIYRIGYYQGLGARKVASNILPSATLPQVQDPCNFDAPTGMTDCGNWAESASWAVPANAVSGVYFALLSRDDNGPGHVSHIFFDVRDDSSHSGHPVPNRRHHLQRVQSLRRQQPVRVHDMPTSY